MNEIEKLNFPNFCYSIGMIPTSYKLSLSYEEQLMWLCDFLENTVIPTVNNNGNAVTELQNLYVQLKNYVDNYLDNLPIQEEVNNKLDEMVADGTLSSILNQELLGQINTNIKNLQDLSTFENTIFVGDSYAVGHTSSIAGWAGRLKNLLGLQSNVNCWYAMLGGSGFIGLPNVSNFQTLLHDSLEYVPNHNNIKRIVVCGGYNDNSYPQEQLGTAITNFINYAKTVYPNAKIYLGMVARCTLKNSTGNTVRHNLGNTVLFRYSQTSLSNGAFYLNGVENILKQNYLMGDDGIHPNDNRLSKTC